MNKSLESALLNKYKKFIFWQLDFDSMIENFKQSAQFGYDFRLKEEKQEGGG